MNWFPFKISCLSSTFPCTFLTGCRRPPIYWHPTANKTVRGHFNTTALFPSFQYQSLRVSRAGCRNWYLVFSFEWDKCVTFRMNINLRAHGQNLNAKSFGAIQTPISRKRVRWMSNRHPRGGLCYMERFRMSIFYDVRLRNQEVFCDYSFFFTR